MSAAILTFPELPDAVPDYWRKVDRALRAQSHVDCLHDWQPDITYACGIAEYRCANCGAMEERDRS